MEQVGREVPEYSERVGQRPLHLAYDPHHVVGPSTPRDSESSTPMPTGLVQDWIVDIVADRQLDE